MSFYARVNYTGDGATSQWAVPFAFLLRDHVKVYLDDVETTSFVWIHDGLIDISTGITPPGTAISIRRQTPVDSRVVDYVDGANLIEEDLDNAQLQTIYIVQELLDTYSTIVTGVGLDADTLDGLDSTAFAVAVHNHVIADITGLQTELDAKALASHIHSIGDITGLQAALDAKAALAHTHTLADITDAGTAAGFNVPATGDAAAGEVVKGDDSRLGAVGPHTHVLADITDAGTSAALNVPATGDAAAGEVVKGDDTRLTDARTPTAHTHVLADVTDAGTSAALNVPATGDAAAGEVVKGDDTRLTDARTPTAHTHVKADITDLAALEDSDFSAAEGFMRKTGAGAYEAIKSNLGAAVAPTTTDDSAAGYGVGSRWIDTTADKEYVCLDATATAAVWTETTGAGGGGGASTLNDLTDVVVATPAAGDMLLHDGTDWDNKSINDLTADATPDGAADYVMVWDASATDNKKVLLDDLPGGGGGAPQKTVVDLASVTTTDYSIPAGATRVEFFTSKVTTMTANGRVRVGLRSSGAASPVSGTYFENGGAGVTATSFNNFANTGSSPASTGPCSVRHGVCHNPRDASKATMVYGDGWHWGDNKRFEVHADANTAQDDNVIRVDCTDGTSAVSGEITFIAYFD